MSKHIKWSSIDQYRNAIKHVRDNAAYHNVPVPVVRFVGTTKQHGTNAGIVRQPSTNETWFQSRENIITPEKDNAGFAIWAHGNREYFSDIFKNIENDFQIPDGHSIQIFGEWAGGSIQKGVGLNQLPKMFTVFGIRISEDAESQDWFTREQIEKYVVGNGENIFNVYQFKTWTIDIDMSRPELAQNQIIDWTIEVENDCPVVRQLLGDRIVGENVGEGIVFTAVEALDSLINVRGLRFKSKGEKHSASKVKVLAAVDTEKVASVNEFADNVCTVSRFEQMLDKMRQEGLDSKDVCNTGTFIKYFMADTIKEELDTLADNGLTTKEIAGPCSTRCRQYYLNQEV